MTAKEKKLVIDALCSINDEIVELNNDELAKHSSEVTKKLMTAIDAEDDWDCAWKKRSLAFLEKKLEEAPNPIARAFGELLVAIYEAAGEDESDD